MIKIEGLCKKFGENVVLDDVNFNVKKGEILGFLGPNGAGKSTTMKIITSFWSPSSGSVKLDGEEVMSNTIAIRKKIGYLPENIPLYEDMLVFEYLKFIAEVRGIEKEKIKERIKSVVDDCGLLKVLRQPIEELSKGFRQRVALAQAIMHEPEILVLDEPTTGLDPNQIVEIRELIKRIGKERTIIFSTHILSEVTATCDRVVIINNGKIVGEGSPSELIDNAADRLLITVKVKGEKEKVMTKLKEIDGVLAVKSIGGEANGVYGFEVETKLDIEIRNVLSKVIVESGWSIYELTKKSVSLEDVFMDLTK